MSKISNNVILVIGDNAAGKTRYLKQLIKNYQNQGLIVINNINNCVCVEDPVKRDVVLCECSDYLENLLINRQNGWYANHASDLLQMIVSTGDILIIDEIDSLLKTQHLIDFCDAISQLRLHWKKIIISGFSSYLMRVFTYLDYDEDYDLTAEIDKPHLILLDGNEQKEIFDRGEAYECITSI